MKTEERSRVLELTLSPKGDSAICLQLTPTEMKNYKYFSKKIFPPLRDGSGRDKLFIDREIYEYLKHHRCRTLRESVIQAIHTRPWKRRIFYVDKDQLDMGMWRYCKLVCKTMSRELYEKR